MFGTVFFTYGDRIVQAMGECMVKLMFSVNNEYFVRRGPDTVLALLLCIIIKGKKEKFIVTELSTEEIVDMYLALIRGMIDGWSFRKDDYDLQG